MRKTMNIIAVIVLLSTVVVFAQTPEVKEDQQIDINKSKLFPQSQLNSKILKVSHSDKAEEDKIGSLKILSKPTAQFTDEARKNGTTGLVRLRVTFLASGTIGDISPVDSLPDGLTESAIEAAKGIKFRPATKNGEPMTVTKLVEYSFANM